MPQSATVLRTKISPPRTSLRTLSRERVLHALSEALNYRLTLVHAGAGYGKTTALAGLVKLDVPLIWYQLMEEDSDPLVFLLHLCHATSRALPELKNLPTSLLEAWDGTAGLLPSTQILDQWLNSLAAGLAGPVLLVMDDAYLAAGSQEIAVLIDRMIGLAPGDLHIVISGRQALDLPNMARWKAQGLALNIDRHTLAFNSAEIATLFSDVYDYELTPGEAELLFNTTEGWAIALQLVWQSLRSEAYASIEEVLSNPVTTLDSLFQILATEIFEGQPDDVQEFLRTTSILRVVTPGACQALNTSANAPAMLAYLKRIELFVVDLGDGNLRYHHIFRNFLQQLTSPEQRCSSHLLAGSYYQEIRELDEAVHHFSRADEMEAVASLLEEYGAQLLAAGRLDTLASHLNSLKPEILQTHPSLFFYMGELARLRSRFTEALGWYQQAESSWRERAKPEGISRALRGQARVYLDIVDPSKAEELLERSIRLSDGLESQEMHARLYELLAENKLNSGQIEEAEKLRKQAEALRSQNPAGSQLLVRVLLRTGRLAQARQLLESQAETERAEPVPTARAHRETQLLLSLIYAFEGRGEEAFSAAVAGMHRGENLQSPFVTAVGYIRQGHAQMLLPGPNSYLSARQSYEKAIELSQELSVKRLRVEVSWGLCRVYGYLGNLTQAQLIAEEGLEIAQNAGDEWNASLIRLSMGAVLARAGRCEQGLEWLIQAARGFQECSDSFGQCASNLWSSYIRFKQGNFDLLAHLLPALLSSCEESGYDFLFMRPTMLGTPDERILVPMLILARNRGWNAAYAHRLLDQMGLAGISSHPGYQLKVTTLGAFAVSRGAAPITPNSWRRAKARQLFQILLTFRSAPLDRDQIMEHLWPGHDPASAARNFKVTLNTLNQVLEPERDPGGESSFILREGSTYSLRPGLDLWLDSEVFSSTLAAAENLLKTDRPRAVSLFEQAIDLYKGDYLPEALYETWAAGERERLEVAFLRAADRLADLYLEEKRFQQAIDLCVRILAVDNCWERAYRQLMLAHHGLGDHGQIGRVFQRCVQTLKDELDVSPSDETHRLFTRLTA